MSAPHVLAAMDDARDVLTALGSPGTANGVAEARAAVAELVEAVAAVYGDPVPCVSDDNAGDDPCQPDCMSCRIRAALARVQDTDADFEVRR